MNREPSDITEAQISDLDTLRTVDGVFVALRKSTRSAGAGACVAAAPHPVTGEMLVTDSKDKDLHAPVLRFTPGEWGAFVLGVKNGDFDGPAA